MLGDEATTTVSSYELEPRPASPVDFTPQDGKVTLKMATFMLNVDGAVPETPFAASAQWGAGQLTGS